MDSNPSSIQPIPTSGIKFAKAGYNVENASDYELLFNSAWPSIAIKFDTSVLVPTGEVVPLAHNLNGYFMAFAYATNANGQFVGRIGQSGTLSDGGNMTFYIGQNSVYISGDFQNPYTVNVKIYTIDLTQSVNYTFINPPSTQIGAYTPRYGARYVKQGKSINSNNLNDFIFHTQAMTPAILSVLTEQDGTAASFGTDLNQLIYVNPAGYVPWIYGFEGNNSTSFEPLVYSPSAFAIQDAQGLLINGDTTSLTYYNQLPATLIVLRDPLFVANSIQVEY
jgi:hypothetical protein